LRVKVIIPTYNEAENLPGLVSALFDLPVDLSVLVVDDNSPDGTGQLADELALQHAGFFEVIHRPGKLGLRSAYLEGFRAAMLDQVDAIAQMDADFSHAPQSLVDMVAGIQNCDVILGSRYMRAGSVDDRWSLWRKWLSRFGNFYARAILGLPFQDVTTGFRLWRRETLQGMPLDRIQSNGYIFLVEMAYLAHCLEYRFGEVPIYFADRKWGKSKMSFRIQFEAALRVWQVWWNYRGLRQMGRLARMARSIQP
jgi:dolichol-phosphate mannosyltransferase